jgi:hypothetical protein
MRAVSDKPFLMPLRKMLESATEKETDAPEELAASMVRGFIPASGMIKTITDIEDPYYREADTFKERVQEGLPWESTKLEPRVGPLGEPIKRNDPFTGSSKPPLSGLYEQLGVDVPSPSRYGKAGERFTAKQYNAILTENKHLVRKILSDVSNAPWWNNIGKKQREQIVAKIITGLRKGAITRIKWQNLQQDPELLNLYLFGEKTNPYQPKTLKYPQQKPVLGPGM